MDAFLDIFWALGKQIPSFFMNPLLYAFVVFAWMQYHRQTLFERKLLHARMNNPWTQLLETLSKGLMGGLFASILLIAAGAIIRPMDVWLVWGLGFLLSFLHIQYLCFAYAGGLLGLLHFSAAYWPQGAEIPGMVWMWSALMELDPVSLLFAAGIFHFIEAMLVKRNQGRGSSPLFISRNRGMLQGAYQLQKFWLLPVFILLPAPVDPAFAVPSGSWWPFFAMEEGIGFSFFLFPAVIGFSDLALSSLPEQRAIKSSRLLLLFSLLLMGLSVAGMFTSWAAISACLFAIFGHEAIIRLGNRREWKQKPIFVQLGQGVVVFAVLPGSPAEKMGIQRGDVLMKVNGREISHADELYPALQLNSAFCKMEVRNVEGNIKYLQRAVYQGEHYQLGLILAPDEHTPYYVHMKPVRMIDLFKQIDKGA